MTARTLEEIEAQPGFLPRITLEELEGRTKFRTPGPWRVAPTSDYPPGENPGLNIDAGEFGLDGFVCEVCGPNPDEQMRADAYFIAHAPDLLAIAQEQRAQIAMLQDNASTAAFDKIADQLGEANRENEEQRAQIAAMRKVIDIARVCANEGGYKECPRTDDHHIALLEMDKAIKAIGTKR